MRQLNTRNAFLSFVVLGMVVVGGIVFYEYNHLKLNFKSFDVTRLGVLDSIKLRQEAKCFKVHEEISNLVTDLVSKIQAAEKQAKSSYNEIKKNSKLSLKAKNKELAKVESKWKSLSRKYNEEMQSIRNMDLKVSDIIQTKLFSVLDSIAKSYKLNLILNKTCDEKLNVLYTSANIDITDLVIKKMDESLPKIKLEELK